MAKSRSQPVNLPGARPLMNPLIINNVHFLQVKTHIFELRDKFIDINYHDCSYICNLGSRVAKIENKNPV